jgi:hypothetical protein
MRDIPDIHFSDTRGWYRWSPNGRALPLHNEPFIDEREAVAYALKQLKMTNVSMYTVIVNARAALEWAAAKERAVSDAGH